MTTVCLHSLFVLCWLRDCTPSQPTLPWWQAIRDSTHQMQTLCGCSRRHTYSKTLRVQEKITWKHYNTDALVKYIEKLIQWLTGGHTNRTNLTQRRTCTNKHQDISTYKYTYWCTRGHISINAMAHKAVCNWLLKVIWQLLWWLRWVIGSKISCQFSNKWEENPKKLYLVHVIFTGNC